MTPEQLNEILPKICTRETSQDPEGWTPDNPLWGHCAVVSLIAQDLFGGILMRASTDNGTHYWNKLDDDTDLDFTRIQFGEKMPDLLNIVIRERSYVLSFPETVKRYWLLKSRLNENSPANSQAS